MRDDQESLRDWVLRRYKQLPESERREMAEVWKSTESHADIVIWDDDFRNPDDSP